MRHLFIAASIAGAAIASASPAESPASSETAIVKKLGNELAYDGNAIEPISAADIKAVVERKPAQNGFILPRRAADAAESDELAGAIEPRDVEARRAIKKDITTPQGYTDPVNIGEAAINALIDCNGHTLIWASKCSALRLSTSNSAPIAARILSSEFSADYARDIG